MRKRSKSSAILPLVRMFVTFVGFASLRGWARIMSKDGLEEFVMTSFSRMSAVVLMLTVAGAIACNAGDKPIVAVPNPAVDMAISTPKGEQTAVIAGGCFWGIQAVFEHVKGVINATSGYSGGSVKDPNYKIVITGKSGHAESAKSVYDPSQSSFVQLLKVFLAVAHDPTELNLQRPDAGTQYRSEIFYT